MAHRAEAATFEATGELDTEGSTVLVGLPGLGLVGVIAVEHVTDELGLPYRGHFASEKFPHVATYDEGRVRNSVRVYADGDLTALQADLVFPPRSRGPLAEGVVEHLTDGCEQVVVPVGAPAEWVDEHGRVTAVTTTDSLERTLREAGVPPAPGIGAIGGSAGAVVDVCARENIPTVALVVRVEPYRPDPAAASALLREGVESVLGTEFDTSALEESERALVAEMAEMARQMQRIEAQEGFERPPPEDDEVSMFQ
ncbi:proteasome assembly chaperone family protein [Halosimplex amylolyticum]|uniref:proteasome assembly chaperone family protein n=1 Tax=Halosimplex amylolyticum TaxID=3396616 RepID=UPI003F56CE8A